VSGYDVAARLAEGRQAVDTVAEYSLACSMRGYQQADLTPLQLHDWYGAEDGMDLRALDADRAVLVALVAAGEDALAVQRSSLRSLAGWEGAGGDAAAEFLRRHCETAAAVVAALRGAAESLGALRDDLWRVVDEKVAAAVGIEGRRAGERQAWLAAAQTVIAGGRDAAAEIVERQVKPFVDNDIRVDWLAAMHTATAQIDACYDRATTAVGGSAIGRFEVPGELGPTYVPDVAPTPVAAAAPAAPTAPAATAPAATVTPEVPAAPSLPEMPGVPSLPEMPSVPEMPAMPSMPAVASMPAGDLGSGLPSGSSGFGGLGQRLADALGGLLDPPADTPADAPEPEAVDNEDVDDEDTEDTKEEEEPQEDDEVEDGEPTGDQAVDPEPVAEPPVAAPPEPPVDAPPPPPTEPAPVDGERTPCEIAADELPQAGQ
jgi:hypothetical protein